jgi:uncharacterized protein YoaH (UPF0181 family)
MPVDKLMKKGKSRKQAIAIMMAEKRKGSKKQAPKKSRGFANLG